MVLIPYFGAAKMGGRRRERGHSRKSGPKREEKKRNRGKSFYN